MNLCTSCKTDFGSVTAFDAHRVGVHEYTFNEGLYMDPPREDGRRCLGEDELEAATHSDGSLIFARRRDGRLTLRAGLESAQRAFSVDPYSSQGHPSE